MSQAKEVLKKIQMHKGVVGSMVLNKDGFAINSTFDDDQTTELIKFIGPLCHDARSAVRNLEPSDDLTFLRVRTKCREIVIAPGREFVIIVIQNVEDQASSLK